MIVTDLDKMERIVRRQKNLIWDEYDVLILIKHNNPVVYKDARFVNGRWYRTVRIPLTRQGWELPNGNRKA